MKPFVKQLQAESLNPQVVKWAGNVLKNGGSQPSFKTISALNHFYNSLQRTSFFSKIKMLNCMVPDNFKACITPLLQPNSNITWIDTYGMSTAQLTINGLKGDGAKTIDCNYKPNQVGTDENNWGVSFMCSGESVSQAGRDFGSTDGSAVLTLYAGWTDNNTYGQGLGGELYSYANGGSPLGFHCFTRIASNNIQLYRGRTVGGFSSLMTSTNANGTHTMVNANMFLFNYGTGNDGFVSNKRFSFLSQHLGLTSTECNTFYTLANQMRGEIGGGTV